MCVITLTTDFGTSDHYVAAMKGVILSIAPTARIVDVTHDVSPQDVVQAAFLFRQAFPWFGPGTVHVVVVDPGVGTSRRLLAARYDGRVVLAPDNGVLSLVHHDFALEALHEILNPRWFAQPVPSATFHGRDMLAPAAARLASGASIADAGPATDRLEVLNLGEPSPTSDGGWVGVVLHVDRFGNLISNIRRADLPAAGGDDASDAAADLPGRSWRVSAGEVDVGPIRRVYAEAAGGELLALFGSGGHLEVAVNGGSAAARLRLGPGADVWIRPA